MGGKTTKHKSSSKRPTKKDSAPTKSADRHDVRKDTEFQSGSNDKHASQAAISRELQQRLLSLFSTSLTTTENDVSKTIQDVKGHLYNRDFVAAFNTEERRRAYALRWSASRALGYAEIFSANWKPGHDSESSELPPTEEKIETSLAVSKEPISNPKSQLKVLCLGGGGGAELVAMAAAHNLRKEDVSRKLEVTVADVADWKDVVDRLGGAVITPPTLSRYASAAARDSATPLLDESRYASKFVQHDVLDSDVDWSSLLQGVDLVTLMFTLNELYSISRLKTTSFLLALTSQMREGAELLVVDSPGTYSTVKLGEQQAAANTHSMSLLLDLTLLGPEKDGNTWVKTVEDLSRWFRLPEGLRYPIELENMRYQIHMYRHL